MTAQRRMFAPVEAEAEATRANVAADARWKPVAGNKMQEATRREISKRETERMTFTWIFVFVFIKLKYGNEYSLKKKNDEFRKEQKEVTKREDRFLLEARKNLLLLFGVN